MIHKFEDQILEGVGIKPTTSTATEAAGTGVDMAKFRNFVAVITLVGATQYSGALTAVIAESTDNTTYSDTYLATVTIASTTVDAIDTVEVKSEQMSAGYRYLRVEATPVGTVSTFSAPCFRFNPRFAAVR